jgi:dTDP-4-amino-4,6-dideoxygalactose transaminase
MGRPVGTFGDIAAFSTMFGKHHASGGQGGLVFTKNEDLYWKARRYADRGKPFGLPDNTGNVVAALNCNMDELRAAIGRVQLGKLPSMIARRRELAQAIATGCTHGLRAVRLVTDRPGSTGTYWTLFFAVDLGKLRVEKTVFVDALKAEGIPAFASYLVVPARMPWCTQRRAFGARSAFPWSSASPDDGAAAAWDLTNAETTDARRFGVEFHEDWTDREVRDLIDALSKLERCFVS